MGQVISHGGEVDGDTSFLGFSLEHRVSAIVLTNAGNAPLDPFGEWLIRHLVGR